ncbi:unnamed protein product [Parascedosporium putredinis]|uniref:Uncharacterized protein n=1 Tax=Parascedosporium putredinis TaxID=1442378 RepID=A0A9P1HAN9_9PEZI|nr:unnamed protein product [Parascedosporium putredinis]CAI8002925.1 unnamed protein product [Parascedosporium putredinis]
MLIHDGKPPSASETRTITASMSLCRHQPPPAIARTAVTALGMARAGLGAVVTLFPGWTAGLIGISLDPAGAVFARAFGVRDLILGELLLTAGGNHAPDGGRREVRRMLWAGLAADAADLVIVSFAWGLETLAGSRPGASPGSLRFPCCSGRKD